MSDRTSHAKPTDATLDSGDIRVLLVDDDERWGRVTAKHLATGHDDLEITFRASVADGMDVLASSPIDCIVSDYQMPDRSGLDFLSAVRERFPDLPFLLLTGRGNEAVASAAIERDVTGYISKDATRSETPVLASRIRTVVETYRAKRRLARAQERIEHLHEVTLDLEQSQTRADVSEQTARAAASTLELGTCRVLIERDGVLQRVASAPTDAEGSTLPALVESVAHDCLETGTPAIRAVGQGGDEARSVLCVPIGSAGVLLATDRARDAYDQHDLNACDILASHAGAALERIRSRERVRVERDSKAAMRDVLTAATDRETVEREVCTHLVEAGGYRLAWVGAFTPTEGLSIRTAAGETGYLDAVAPTADATSDGDSDRPEPSVQALVAEESTAAVIDSDPAIGWERAAVDHGLRHIVARPLVEENVFHGVLAVYADHEIDDHRLALLEEYADTLAVAIGEAKRTRVLQGETVTKLELQVPASGSPIAALSRALATRGETDAMTVQSVVPADETVRYVVTTTSMDEDALRAAAGTPEADRVRSVEALDDDGDRFVVSVPAPTVESVLLDHGGKLGESTVEAGTAVVTAEYSERRDARSVVDAVRDVVPDVTVRAVHDVEGATRGERTDLGADLTAKQRRALKTAYVSGYFERPRTQNADDIAETLDVSRQAFFQHLRVAERKVFGQLFDGE
jgi:predicted DNA binding protein/DNA-binding NarL/FixJ family response regulator